MRARTALAIGIPSILGLVLLGLAVPRTGAAWWALGSPYAFEKQTVLKPLAAEEIAQGRASLEAALQWQESSQLLLELATLELSAALALACPSSEHLRQTKPIWMRGSGGSAD